MSGAKCSLRYVTRSTSLKRDAAKGYTESTLRAPNSFLGSLGLLMGTHTTERRSLVRFQCSKLSAQSISP